MALRDNFEGTGSMVEFVKETNTLFSAVNNIKFIMPSGYLGVEPTVKVEPNSITFDFGQALIFTLNNVVWNFSGTGFTEPNNVVISSRTATVVNGKLTLSVVVDKVV
jgi:hypothetical protein